MKSIRSRLTLILICMLVVSSVLSILFAIAMQPFLPDGMRMFQYLVINTTVRQAFSLLISVILGAILTAVMLRVALKPVRQLTDAAKRVAAGDFSQKVPMPKGNVEELNQLIINFNKMTEELKGNVYMRKNFVSSISHEFKTPVASINAYATLLAQENISDQERRDYAAVIVEETQRLSKLSQNILRLSKLESQTIFENYGEYSLSEQLRKEIMLLEPRWSAKNIDLDVDLCELKIRGDRDLLSQVWQNLLENAIKFTPDGGAIAVRLKKSDDGVGLAQIEIEDNGIGMDEETLSHIYEQFYQAETSHANEGNGLGMALVKRILDMCHATIDIKSQPGQGTKVTVWLSEEGV